MSLFISKAPNVRLSGLLSDEHANVSSASALHHAAWQEGEPSDLAPQIAVLDRQGLIIAVNRIGTLFAVENEVEGQSHSHSVGDNFLDSIRSISEQGDKSAEVVLNGLVAMLAGEIPHFELEYSRHGHNEEHWFLMQVSPLLDKGGGVVSHLAISHLNITQRKKTARVHSQLAAILEATPDFVGMVDEAGETFYANRALRQIRGLNLLPDTPLGTIPDYHPEWAIHKLRKEGFSEAIRNGAWSGEMAILDSSGHEILVHQVILAHRDETGKLDYFSTIMRDQTAPHRQAAELQQAFDELKRTQEQLVLSEKMASIGQLAAGVAHEINNPIGYLHSNLSTLGQYLEDTLRVVAAYEVALPSITDSVQKAAIEQLKKQADFDFVLEDIPKLLAESQEGIQRVRKIVQDLKDFAHAGENEEWKWADLRISLSRTLNIVHNELKYKATVEQHFEEIPEIRCLPGQLNQVFMNLLVNASHAIKAEGRVQVNVRKDNEYVCVEISDTGCGMPPEIIEHIFEPFFTTKPVGKGTGLGLSISNGIVKKHGGHIEVDSELNKGTTFRVILPISGPPEGAM